MNNVVGRCHAYSTCHKWMMPFTWVFKIIAHYCVHKAVVTERNPMREECKQTDG